MKKQTRLYVYDKNSIQHQCYMDGWLTVSNWYQMISAARRELEPSFDKLGDTFYVDHRFKDSPVGKYEAKGKFVLGFGYALISFHPIDDKQNAFGVNLERKHA